MNDDAELLRSYVEHRSEDAFTALVQRHIGLVYATALRRLGYDAHLADDVTQSVFTDLARKAASLRGHATVAGWLYVSTQLATAALVRREQRRKAREATAQSVQIADAPHDPEPDAARLRPLLDDVIVELKNDEREVIVLRFFEQRTFSEIGAALLVTEEAARKRVDRALDKLRHALNRRSLQSTAAALGVALTASGAATVPAGLVQQVSAGALASAAAAVPATTAAVTCLPAAAVLALGACLLVPQYRANQAVAAELARFTATAATLSAARTENDQLARTAASVRDLERIAAELPALRTTLATLPPPPPAAPAPLAKSVTITPQGTIEWDGKPVTLDDFVLHLAALQAAAPANESKLSIHANGTRFLQMLYALDEARKAGIKHIVVESDVMPEPQGPAVWF